MADVAELAVTVTRKGVEETTTALNQFSESATTAAVKTRYMGEAADGLSQTQRDLLTRMQAVTTASQSFDATNAAAVKTLAQEIDNVRALAAATGNLDLVQMQLVEATATMNAALNIERDRYNENRQIVLAHADALRLDAEMQDKAALASAGFGGKLSEVSSHLDGHNLQLGRLEHGLAAVTGHAIGLNGPMERMGSIFLNMGVGGVWGFAIIGGLAAITALVEHLTSASEKAEKASQKLIDKLREQHEVEEEGKSGKAISDLQKRIEEDQKAVDKIQRQIDSPAFNRSESVSAALKAQLDAAENVLAEDQHILIYSGKDLSDKLNKAFDEGEKSRSEELAHLVKYQKDRADVRADALKQLAVDEALEQQFLKAGMVARAAIYADAAEAIKKALKPEKIAAPDRVEKETNPIILGLQKQLEEMRQVDEEEKIANVNREYEIKLIGMSGYARDYLVAQQRAEIDSLKAYHELAGLALNERLATIQADLDADLAKAKLVRTMKEEADTRTMLNDIVKDVTAIGKRNEAIDKAEIEQQAKKIKAAQDYQDELERIARTGIERLLAGGLKSYEAFFGDILKSFQALMDAMEKEAKKHNTTPGFGFQALGAASAGIAGGLAGFNIGQSTGSGAIGAIGGGLSGFEVGNAILPGIGGAIGALTGAVGGLFGAAEAHKKAAEALQKAADQVRLSLLSLNAQAGTGTALDANIAQAKSQADKLFDAIDAALPGLKNQTEREKEMAQVRADEAIIVQQLIDADKKARAAFDDSAQARILAAQGDTKGAAAIRQRVADEKELNDATKQFGAASAEVAALLAAQAAEAKQRAEDAARASARIDEDLRIRQKYAQGLTAEGDALKREQEERDQLDAAMKAGWTEAQIAALKLTQAMEDQKKAADDAAAATERTVHNMADLTTQFLALIGDTNGSAVAALLEQQRQATNAAVTAGATPTELAMLAAVQLLQRGQLAAEQAAKAQQDVLNAQLKTANTQLATEQSTLQATTQAAQTFSKFNDSLSTSALSPLSPVAQLAAARAQLDSLYQRAAGGDASAASDFTSAANTFLTQSRGYNASGPAFVRDFASVQQMTATLTQQYGAQQTDQQKIVTALQTQIDQLNKALALAQDANAIAAATKAAAVQELQATADAAVRTNGVMIDRFAALAATLTGVGHDVTASEHDLLVGNQNSIVLATAAETAAINAGASLQQVAQLEQIRQLSLQKALQDQQYAQQIAAAGAAYGYGSQQVQQLIALQKSYDTGVDRQIGALNNVGTNITASIELAGRRGTDTNPWTGLPRSGGFTGDIQLTETRAQTDTLRQIAASGPRTVAVLQDGFTQLLSANEDLKAEVTALRRQTTLGSERIVAAVS